MNSRAVPVQRKAASVPWWAVLLGGIVAVILGILLMAWPAATANDLFFVLGVLAIAGGVVALASIFRSRAQWGWRVLAGVLAILFGLALIGQPLFSAYLAAAIILWVLGALFIVVGLVLIIMAFAYAGWAYGIGGALCVILGAAVVLAAAVGPLKAPWIFALAMIAGGILAVVAAFRMRRDGSPATDSPSG
jgi:uncharacterized membrane protein HdeD (DUF308 family)